MKIRVQKKLPLCPCPGMQALCFYNTHNTIINGQHRCYEQHCEHVIQHPGLITVHDDAARNNDGQEYPIEVSKQSPVELRSEKMYHRAQQLPAAYQEIDNKSISKTPRSHYKIAQKG